MADDRALPDAAHPRGLAGTLFVHRIAGGMAAAGHGLALVVQAAREAAADLASIGLALSGCDPYGAGDAARAARPGPDAIELGLGIHGEPGAERWRAAGGCTRAAGGRAAAAGARDERLGRCRCCA